MVRKQKSILLIKPIRTFNMAFQAQTANFSEAIERLIILGETQGSIIQCIQ